MEESALQHLAEIGRQTFQDLRRENYTIRIRSDFEVLLLQFGIDFEDLFVHSHDLLAHLENARTQLEKRFGAETQAILDAAEPRYSAKIKESINKNLQRFLQSNTRTLGAEDVELQEEIHIPNVEEQLRTAFRAGRALSQVARRSLDGPLEMKNMTFQHKLVHFFIQPEVLKLCLFFKPVSRGPPVWRFCAPLEDLYEPLQPSVGEEDGDRQVADEPFSFEGMDPDDVIENVTHISPPASPHPCDAMIGEELWASNVERRVFEGEDANSDRLAHVLPAATLDMGTFREAEVTASEFSAVSGEHLSNDTASKVHESENIWLLCFKRNPDTFRQCLEGHISLQSCRHALEEAGHLWNLPSGAKVFVHPWQYDQTIDFLQRGEWPVHALRPYHVVVAESLEHLVEESLSGVPCREGARVKKRSAIGISQPTKRLKSNAEVDIDSGTVEYLDCKRTFICIARSLRNADSVTQSTSEAHASRNPRRQLEAMHLSD